jgi:outer membrane protein assembly factor BamB
MSLLSLDPEELSRDPRRARMVIGGTVAVLVIVCVVAIAGWLSYNPALALVAEVPGTDGLPENAAAFAERVELRGIFESAPFDGKPSDLPGAWPNFRGPNLDSIAADAPRLADSWPNGPNVLWQIPVGDGYAAPAVLNGRVYLMDYDVEKRADALRCLSLDDGKEIWRRSYNVNIRRNHGMSRTIPAVTDKYLVAIGPKCHVVCVDSRTGDFRWGIDLQMDYGTKEPDWYAGQCPIIVDDVAIIAPAGTDVLMMGVSCESGDVLWTTPNPMERQMSHASIVPMTLDGHKMYVYSAQGGVVGVSAEPDRVGELLWDVPRKGNVVAPSAVQVSDTDVFATMGYNEGSMLIRVTENGGGFDAELIYHRNPKEMLACEQQTPIFHNGLLYSIMPKGAGELSQQFVCFTPEGELVWGSGRDNRFGLGPFILADNKFYILGDDATLTMIDATANGYKQLGQGETIFHMADDGKKALGHDAWGPLALAGSRLLLRDMNYLACVELGAS